MLAGGRAGGDDRERRRAWPACRSARCRSTTRSRSISPGRSSRRPRPISAPRRSIRGRRRCWRTWSRSAAGSAARTARASTTIRRRARRSCGRGSPTCRRRSSIPTRSTSQELKQRLLAMQALETARCFEEGVLTDVREADVGSILGFGFAPFSGGTLSYIDMMGDEELRRAVPAAGEEIRRALRAVEAAARHGGEGRELLRPLRARKEGGVMKST